MRRMLSVVLDRALHRVRAVRIGAMCGSPASSRKVGAQQKERPVLCPVRRFAHPSRPGDQPGRRPNPSPGRAPWRCRPPHRRRPGLRDKPPSHKGRTSTLPGSAAALRARAARERAATSGVILPDDPSGPSDRPPDDRSRNAGPARTPPHGRAPWRCRPPHRRRPGLAGQTANHRPRTYAHPGSAAALRTRMQPCLGTTGAAEHAGWPAIRRSGLRRTASTLTPRGGSPGRPTR